MPNLEALVTPGVVRWARLRAKLSVAEVAKKISVSPPTRVEAWEQDDGEDRPTFRQAQNLADALHVPFGYLFLPEPPVEPLPLPDLRTKPNRATRLTPSSEFLDVAYDAMRKQEWYHEYLQNQDAHSISFVGKYTETTPVTTVAADIRRVLGMNDNLRREARDNDDYFRLLVARAERSGVMVVRTSIVGNNTHRTLDPNEFQGFAKADNLAPLVFVNQNDYQSAQIFTLMHELAHIWIGVSGISDSDYLEKPETDSTLHQRRADQIAAEALVPGVEFALRWDNSDDDARDRLARLRRHYKVSVFVLLRRAYDLGKLSASEYRSLYEELGQQVRSKKAGGGGGGYSSLFSRNSHTIATAVLHAVFEGKVPPTEGATLLNVRPPTLYSMERFLASAEA